MRRAFYWFLRVAFWVGALGLGYVGVILLFFGSMFGPRGDIDYPDFSAAKKHAADIQAMWTQLSGLVPLAFAGVLMFWSRWLATAIVRLVLRKAKEERVSSLFD